MIVVNVMRLVLSGGRRLPGWNKLLMYMANEWLKDIRLNQIHSILKGFGSFSILCQIGECVCVVDVMMSSDICRAACN